MINPLLSGLILYSAGQEPYPHPHWLRPTLGHLKFLNRGSTANGVGPGGALPKCWLTAPETGRGLRLADTDALDMGTEDFAVGLWMKPSTTLRGAYVAKMAGAGGAGWYIADADVSDGNVAIQFGIGDGTHFVRFIKNVTNGFPNLFGAWHRVICERRSGMLSVYVDGVRVGDSVNATTVGNVNVNLPVNISDYSDDPGSPVPFFFAGITVWRGELPDGWDGDMGADYEALALQALPQAIFSIVNP